MAEKKALPARPETYIRRERFYGQIKRCFYIGMKKENDVKAKYSEGVLTISFPKEDAYRKEQKDININ